MNKPDFAGWVTKNDIQCSDGVTIRRDAFKDNNGVKVPLVWQHDYSSPENVLGHMALENRDNGVYGFGFFNETEQASHAKSLVKHGDVASLSIGARKIKKRGSDVIHGSIYEVSLVLSGANPGALIDAGLTHSDEDDVAVIFTGLNHQLVDEDTLEELTHAEGGSNVATNDNGQNGNNGGSEKTIADVIATLDEEQRTAVEALVGMVIEDYEENGAGDDTVEQGYDYEEEDNLKHNVFDGQGNIQHGQPLLTKEDQHEIIKHAKEVGTLKHGMETSDVLMHELDGDVTRTIGNMDYLFPEAHNVGEPTIIKDTQTGYEKVLAGVKKQPFMKIRTRTAHLDMKEARARGYITGNEKKEQYFEVNKRDTTGQTIYKKQRLERDDIIDITDFDIVNFLWKEMREALNEEIARAILVGDGREVDDPDKINENRIRPIISDDDFYTIKKRYTNVGDLLETVLKTKRHYRGSGSPTLFIDEGLLTEYKLQKGTDGRYLLGHIPSDAEVASQFGVSNIVTTTFLGSGQAVLVNLADYAVGTNKGGEITTFDDFDIDFNEYKYLIEARMSGALVLPKSAIFFSTNVTESDVNAAAPAYAAPKSLDGSGTEREFGTYKTNRADLNATPEEPVEPEV